MDNFSRHIGNVIIPTDELTPSFFREVAKNRQPVICIFVHENIGQDPVQYELERPTESSSTPVKHSEDWEYPRRRARGLPHRLPNDSLHF